MPVERHACGPSAGPYPVIEADVTALHVALNTRTAQPALVIELHAAAVGVPVPVGLTVPAARYLKELLAAALADLDAGRTLPKPKKGVA